MGARACVEGKKPLRLSAKNVPNRIPEHSTGCPTEAASLYADIMLFARTANGHCAIVPAALLHT